MNILAKIKELEERLDDIEIIENEYIEPVETGLGTELIIKNQPTPAEDVEDAPDAVPCKIVGGTGPYAVQIYANGKGNDPTGNGTLDVLELLWQEQIPSGTWVIGHESTVIVTGEDD